MRNAEDVTFGRDGLDRAAHLRGNASALAGMLGDPSARVLPMWKLKPLFCETEGRTRLGWVEPGSSVLQSATEPYLFLGLEDGAPRFAADISNWEAEAEGEASGFLDRSRTPHPALGPEFGFGDLRAAISRIACPEGGQAATARGLLAWHETHGFCARCGAPSQIVLAGWQRLCPACGAHHFPRTDPVVIVLALDGDRVLLGRSPGWPEGMLSLLAGFMEPGETVEAAARREVFEEAGVRLGRVDYLASQPWPFPSSLMIGVRAEAETTGITLDKVELEAAEWIPRAQIIAALNEESPRFFPARRGAIARFLIEAWLRDDLD